MHAQCCPVCHGKGIVSPGFYDRPGTTWATGTNATAPQCRSCAGKGYIVVPTYAPPVPQTPAINPNRWVIPDGPSVSGGGRVSSSDMPLVTVRYGA